MKRNSFVCITLFSLLAGCSYTDTFHEHYVRSSYGQNEAGYPTATKDTDPEAYLRAYLNADHLQTVAPLDAFFNTMLWDKKENNAYTAINIREYRPHSLNRTSGHLLLAMNEVCSIKGGHMSGHWCFKFYNNQFVPMFYIEASDVYNWKNRNNIKAKLITPRNGDFTAKAWLDYASPSFETDSIETYQKSLMTAEETAATLRRAKKLIAKVKNKPNENQFMLSSNSKGYKVCRAERQNAVSIGFIEDHTESRIKVNIIFSGYPPNIQFGGFRPHTIWETPDNWWLCE